LVFVDDFTGGDEFTVRKSTVRKLEDPKKVAKVANALRRLPRLEPCAEANALDDVSHLRSPTRSAASQTFQSGDAALRGEIIIGG
jgi:hypothetical protein